jgi:hypothetical protein
MADWFAYDQTELDPELDALIKPEFVPGERLLWASSGSAKDWGRRSPVLSGSLVSLAALTICSLSLAAFWGVFGNRIQIVEGILALIGILSGVTFVIAAFSTFGAWISGQIEGMRAVRATYALTDRRLILWRPHIGKKGVAVESYPRGSFQSVQRVEYQDGTGDVTFVVKEKEAHFQWQPPALIKIAGARRVESLVRDTLLADDPPTSSSVQPTRRPEQDDWH